VAKVHHVGLTPGRPTEEFARWSLPVQVDWREWDGEFVVRSERSGATCLLSALAGETLKALHGGAVYQHDIAARVLANYAPPHSATAALMAQFADGDAAALNVRSVLVELEALGLVRADPV